MSRMVDHKMVSTGNLHIESGFFFVDIASGFVSYTKHYSMQR